MLDLKIFRENGAAVQEALRSKKTDLDLAALLALDEQRRELIADAETLKKKRNDASKAIGEIKKSGGDAEAEMAAVRDLGDEISEKDASRSEVETKLTELVMALPNLPHASVPIGNDESANKEIRSWGEIKTFDFEAKAHWDLGEQLGIMDFPRASKMSGSGFPLLLGAGARLSRALTQFMLDIHTKEHGYTEVEPPVLCNDAALTGTGQLPKMAEEMYRIDLDELWLIPTAEVPVTNIFHDDIIAEALPLAFTAFTPCFRREAGAAGKMTRGFNRVHQFNKVELVRFVEPESSYEELEKLLGHAETILQRLELPYRLVELCSADLSFASAKTYDLELWAPGQELWLEVSSCSNFEDFQARRAKFGIATQTASRSSCIHSMALAWRCRG